MQAPSFRLVTLTFDTIAATAGSPLTLSINALGDASGSAVLANLQNASITITAVPEPATYAMLLAGLCAVGFGVRRNKQGKEVVWTSC